MMTADKSDMNIQLILQQRARDLARVMTDSADLDEGVDMLIFKLANEKYALDINYVKEIQNLCNLTPLMGVPRYWAGLINLRGGLLPVLDLQAYLGLGQYIPGNRTQGEETTALEQVNRKSYQGDGTGQIVYTSTTDMLVGLLVNQAQDVKKINREDVHALSKEDSNNQSRSVIGVTSDFITVLDISQLFSELSVIDMNG